MHLSEDKLLVKLKRVQDKELFTHSKATNHMALRLAENLKKNNPSMEIDMEKISLAALLHDWAKDFSPGTLLESAKKYKIHLSVFEKENPGLLHGPVSAAMVKHELGIKDKEILNAIEIHTTGDRGMTIFDKIIYVADHVEFNRDYRMVDEIRKIALTDLDKAVTMVIENKIYYILQKKKAIHPKTIAAWNDIIKKTKNLKLKSQK